MARTRSSCARPSVLRGYGASTTGLTTPARCSPDLRLVHGRFRHPGPGRSSSADERTHHRVGVSRVVAALDDAVHWAATVALMTPTSACSFAPWTWNDSGGMTPMGDEAIPDAGWDAHRWRHKVPNMLAASIGTALLLLTGPVLADAGQTIDTTPPSVEYDPLYRAVALAGIFPDSKTFPDLVPTVPPSTILRNYLAQKGTRGFDLAGFVRQHFSPTPEPPGPIVQTAASGTKLLNYVHGLWSELTQTGRIVPAYSTLLPLPFPYVVPGGRFREVYYCDSYFTMLGLIEDRQHAVAVGMLKDFTDEISRYGHVPNGNRSYYLSRSQPPFFSFMVALIEAHDGKNVLRSYLPQLQAEYDYWMQGATTVPPGQAFRHVVRLSDGTLLNRYWDARAAPRDESYEEDVETASHSNRPKGLVWRDLRAATETGWDFSSRWLADGKTLATVRALEIAPVDLNALLVHLEQMLARGHSLQGDVQRSRDFYARAERRASAVRH